MSSFFFSFSVDAGLAAGSLLVLRLRLGLLSGLSDLRFCSLWPMDEDLDLLLLPLILA